MTFQFATNQEGHTTTPTACPAVHYLSRLRAALQRIVRTHPKCSQLFHLTASFQQNKPKPGFDRLLNTSKVHLSSHRRFINKSRDFAVFNGLLYKLNYDPDGKRWLLFRHCYVTKFCVFRTTTRLLDTLDFSRRMHAFAIVISVQACTVRSATMSKHAPRVSVAKEHPAYLPAYISPSLPRATRLRSWASTFLVHFLCPQLAIAGFLWP